VPCGALAIQKGGSSDAVTRCLNPARRLVARHAAGRSLATARSALAELLANVQPVMTLDSRMGSSETGGVFSR